MAYQDLRDFIRTLEKRGELKRIPFEVDPVLEITEFADRSVKTGGPAFLFERPKGSDIPVLINSFASMRRMELALQVDSVEDVAQRIAERLGRPVAAHRQPLGEWQRANAGLPPYALDALSRMFAYYDKHDFATSSHPLESLLGRKPTTFAEFVAREVR